MSTEIKLPELGENIESADIVSVLVKAGDQIDKDQSIIEIETDKATVEVPSTMSGTIEEVLVKEGDTIKVGQVIIKMADGQSSTKDQKEDKQGEKKSSDEPKEVKPEKKTDDKPKEKSDEKKPSDKTAPGKSELVDVKLPELGEGIDSADVIGVLVSAGDKIEKDQGLIEIETDKATVEVPSPVAGIIKEVLIEEGEKAKVGSVIFKVETSEVKEDSTDKSPEQEEKKAGDKKEERQEVKEDIKPKGEIESSRPGEIDEQPPITTGAAPAAPSVRRIARELGVDINKVSGSGPGGRISMDDVKAYVKKLNESREASGFGVRHEALPDFSKFGSIERESFSKIRSKTAEHLSYAWVSIPHVTQHDKADITELEKARKAFNPGVEKAGGKLTITAILVKVITSALKKFPRFNSSIDMEKQEVIFKKYFNIGIAVDTEHGLIVPNIKNADNKNIIEISIELNQLAEKARNKKISLDELQGGCFTITNLGGIGGTSFTPIVNSPEAAILGVSRGSYEPVFIEGRFVPRFMLPLSLSYDHRIIDGADAARFLRWVAESLEQPLKILIEG